MIIAGELERVAEAGSEAALLGVDVGGTFTDAALVSGGRLSTAKVPTTPADQSAGVMSAVELVLAQAGLGAERVSRFGHGMTVGTNALLEERGARTALVATDGFTDVIEIGRQARPDLYRLCRAAPSPLVPAELRFGARERMSPKGIVVPLDEDHLAGLLDRLAGEQPEAVAIALLHSYADPAHEQRIAAAVAERLPNVHVSASHEVLSLFREYERSSTTVIDAYLSPLLRSYLERLAARAAEAGLPEPEVMQSSGGMMTTTAAAHHAARTVLSGPAAGAVGAAHVGRLTGGENVLSFDMGGTSCDVAVVDAGKVRRTRDRTIGGRVLQLPMVDVHTVGAGGGSIAWIDAGGALRVGPQSAGAEPGPACYGKGGTDATVTDANLVLGYLDAGSSLAGGVSLDVEAAERAVGKLGGRPGLSMEEAAWGIARVADQEMLRALRVVTVERGIDPRRYSLVAFGGAGPMHAARIAEELEIERVLCPRAAGVLSALGLVVSDRRRDLARSLLLAGSELTEERVGAAVEELAEAARQELPEGRVETRFDLRYRGQAFELTVEAPEHPDPAALRERFEQAHSERYGYADSDAELELVNVRVAVVSESARPALTRASGSGPAARRSARTALFAGERLPTTVVRGELARRGQVDGPAICELPEATAVVPPGWRAEMLGEGTLALEFVR